MATPDLFVIGGGPAGLAVAIAARRKGFSVIVADGACPPVDKACGEGLLPDGLPSASEIGFDFANLECFPIRGIRFLGSKASVVSDFPQGNGFGVRRLALHRELVRLAESSGVELRWGNPVSDFSAIQARWIIGADGAGSRVRSWAGLEDAGNSPRRYGFRLHFRIAPWSEYIEVHWGAGCQVYVTPVARDEVGIALLSGNPKLRVREALRQFPELLARLQGVETNSAERGAVTTMRRLRRVARGNVALVGDASGSVDAITGEGLCLGFRQALALAEATERGDLAGYEAAHRRLARRPRLMAGLLLTLDRWPSVRTCVFPLLAAYPRVFAQLLALHVGAGPQPVTKSQFRPA